LWGGEVRAVWAVGHVEDYNVPEDDQWDCWAWVNGPSIKERNDGSALISKD